MGHFVKNNLHALFHCFSTDGRDSRQAFCDIYRGSIVLALFGIFMCVWRNRIAIMFVRDWLVISEAACWVLCGLFEVWIIATFSCAVMRRWQDLDIKIPRGESFGDLLKRPRFWEVLAHEEGGKEANQYGDAPKENPDPLVDEEDLRKAIREKLFVGIEDEVEELK